MSTPNDLGSAAVLTAELTESLGDVSQRWDELTTEQRRTMLMAIGEAVCDLVAGLGQAMEREGVEVGR